jgi:hypothetical protein
VRELQRPRTSNATSVQRRKQWPSRVRPAHPARRAAVAFATGATIVPLRFVMGLYHEVLACMQSTT